MNPPERMRTASHIGSTLVGESDLWPRSHAGTRLAPRNAAPVSCEVHNATNTVYDDNHIW
jgi:hypothetical protein